MKVLVVDDSRVARMLIMSIIKEFDEQIELLEAENGEEGIALYKKEIPDLTLLDLTMPVIDGYEALKSMKAVNGEKPIYILTADTQRKAVELCLSLGAEDVINKLPRKEDLFKVLEGIRKRGI